MKNAKIANKNYKNSNLENFEIDLKIEKIIDVIKKNNFKKILLQFPEGLKAKAIEIADIIEKKTKAKVFIWLNSCYGSCDIPVVNIKFDAIFSFGHSLWPFQNKIKARELD